MSRSNASYNWKDGATANKGKLKDGAGTIALLATTLLLSRLSA
jgi:hypothetical protein